MSDCIEHLSYTRARCQGWAGSVILGFWEWIIPSRELKQTCEGHSSLPDPLHSLLGVTSALSPIHPLWKQSSVCMTQEGRSLCLAPVSTEWNKGCDTVGAQGWGKITVAQIISLHKPQFPYLFNGADKPLFKGPWKFIRWHITHLAHWR